MAVPGNLLHQRDTNVTTMHRREQTIYLQLINKQKKELKKVTYLHIYRMENCFRCSGFGSVI